MLSDLLSLCLLGRMPALPGTWPQAWSLRWCCRWRACWHGRCGARPGCGPRGWCLLALVSPLCRLARTLVSGHMLQLWVLTMAAPLLMAAGNLAGDRPRHGARRARWLAPATLAYAAALWLRHLPDVYGAALTSPAVHVAVVALLVGSSLWFWNGVLRTRHAGAGDTGRAVPALLATTAHTGLLGALPTFASTSFYPLQTGSATAWGLSHLEDQQLAGMLMWVPGSLAYLAAGTVLALARMREDDAAARPVLAWEPLADSARRCRATPRPPRPAANGQKDVPMTKTPDVSVEPYDGPAGGWGSMKSLVATAARFGAVTAIPLLARQNKPDGFTCASCAWGRPAQSHLAEFCENGAKATFSELTSKRIGAEFFAQHTLAELRTWPDYELELRGRLTEPLRYDAASDRYLPVGWDEAFAAIGAELQGLDPKSVVFYASGRASLETSYMYQLLARLYGCNNLPDSSNMCHETTSVVLKKTIGMPVGSVHVSDFAHTDCIFFFGQNVGSNSQRMLHQLQEARERGIPIVVFNPLRERGLEEFVNPQSPTEMLTGRGTAIATQYHQVRPGGDIAAIAGLCKALFALDDAAQAAGTVRVLDQAFIDAHTHGLADVEAYVRGTAWEAIEAESGLARSALESAARVYAQAEAVIGVYGMGLTQHKRGIDNVGMLVNLMLLRGNVGKSGAGLCPVRGHSNVQGQRTVGIAEKPELVPLDTLAAQYGFSPPRDTGLGTVDACAGVLDGSVQAFIGLGGNFVRAVPDHHRIEPAWGGMRLTVQIATKLNRSHLLHGAVAYLLPCLGRIEVDTQASGVQTLSTEDSTGWFHASRGHHAPASDQLLSEARIVAGIAKATLPHNPQVDWDRWCADYAHVRDAIAETFPEIFHDFNRRLAAPGGFQRPLPARERVWKTASKKAEFTVPAQLSAAFPGDGGPGVFRLMTLRSNDQFNTTVYGHSDRFRGIEGTRMVVFMHADDIAAQGLQAGDVIGLECAAGDGVDRAVQGFTVVAHDLPRGSLGAYYPECNPLIPLWQHADESKVPAAKSVPVRLRTTAASAAPASGRGAQR